MLTPVFRHGRLVVLACALGVAGTLLGWSSDCALGVTPNSPEVKAAIEKGIAFLESEEAVDLADRVGARALQGYALLSWNASHTHAKVVAAAARVQKAITTRDPTKFDTTTWDVYSTGLAIIFLVKLDPKKYHDDIELLLAYLRTRQKAHGGWGYVEKPTGDTSMSQYGVLSSLVATQAGFDVPVDSIDRVAGWLLKTQDPSGGFGYQGEIAPAAALIPQSDVRPSMTAAASGSLYMCASLLGLIEKKEKDEKLPSALKEIKSKENTKERVRSRIDPRLVREAEERAKIWMEKNNKIDKTIPWVNYYLYALERCMAFRELFEHASEKEPQWYNDGAAFLMKDQADNGSWNGQCGIMADTAFAVLFLMRATKKNVIPTRSYGEGTMIVGHGIPKQTDKIEVGANGQITARPLVSGVDKLLKALDKASGQEFDQSVGLLADLPAEQIESLKSKYGDKIRRLVGNASADARLAAVKALGTTRDLDSVETLIYALTDPDYRVMRAANEALLRIRRVAAVAPLPDSFSEEDRRLLVEKWKAWYQSIRPSAEMKY
jgi:hypothetical protein